MEATCNCRMKLQDVVLAYLTKWMAMKPDPQWVMPNLEKGLMFLGEEYGETLRAYLRTFGDKGFVRNNPGAPEEGVPQELGDIILMAIVNAIILDVDIEALILEKLAEMDRKREAKCLASHQ